MNAHHEFVSSETDYSPTGEAYQAIIRAFRHFNAALFESRLPEPIFVFQRKKGARGYFWGEMWNDHRSNSAADEIALNPNFLEERTLEETLSTLVHEMVHVEQHHFGTPSRQGYHNREWAAMMDRVGLIPSATGAPGGARTGQKMTHYIEEGGRFAVACTELLADGFALNWRARNPAMLDAAAKKKAVDRMKFTCPCCGQNAWAKPSARIVCGDCEEAMQRA